VISVVIAYLLLTHYCSDVMLFMRKIPLHLNVHALKRLNEFVRFLARFKAVLRLLQRICILVEYSNISATEYSNNIFFGRTPALASRAAHNECYKSQHVCYGLAPHKVITWRRACRRRVRCVRRDRTTEHAILENAGGRLIESEVKNTDPDIIQCLVVFIGEMRRKKWSEVKWSE